MSNSNSGITFGNKIGMIEDTVIQQQSFIARILQSIQTFLEYDQNHQSNDNLSTQFNQIVNDFQEMQNNFNFNTTQDHQLFSKIDLNDQIVNEHQIKLEDMDSELKTVKLLLNNLKDGAPSDEDFEEYKNKIKEIEEERAKNQIDPILKSIKCIKYEMKKMKDKFGDNDNIIEKNEVNQPNLQSNDPVVSKIYSDLYKVRDDLKEDINSLQEEAEPLLNEETRKFPGKLKTFKRELKQLKKIQEDIEKTNSDLLERQEKIFAKLKQLRDEKINPLDEKVDKLQSSFDSLGENNKDLERQDILSTQEELKGKIDELTAQINLLEGKAFEQNGLAQARDDLQSLKNAVDVEIPENLSTSEEEDSDITSSNMLDALKGLKLKVSDLSIQNKRHDQCINQLLDSSNSMNNTFCENLDSRVQALEKQLRDLNPLSSNMIQNSTPINEMSETIKCLKFEVKRLKALKDENNNSNTTQINEMRESINDLKSEIENLKTTKDEDNNSNSSPKERGVNIINGDNNNDGSNSERFDELENEIQSLKEELNNHIKELTDSFDTIKEKVANQIETDDNSSIKRDVQCLKYEIKRLKNKQSQNNEETNVPSSKIDAIESNISDIKRELSTTIEEQLGQYNGKLQSLEDTILSLVSQLDNQKEQENQRNASNQNTEKWPLISVPAEKHEVNPLIAVLREKIHSLVDEMNQAPDQSEDVNKMKPSMQDTQNHLKKLQDTLNTLLIQEEYQKVQLTPQLMWDEFCELKDRVDLLEKGKHKTHSIKDRDVIINDEDSDYDEFNVLKNDIKCIKYEIKKLKDGQTIASSSEELDLISQKVAELYGSQHQAIKVINSQSSQIQQHHTTINDQLSRIEELESSIKQLDRNDQNHEEIDELTNELNELKDKLLLIEEENEKFKGQINLLEDSSYAFLGPTTTSKKDRNPVIVMLEAQISELLQQIEDPTLQEEPDETGELHPTMDQAEQDLIAVQKELRELLEKEQADGKHEAAKAFNLVHKHMQQKINRLEKTIIKQNETFKAVQMAYNDIESIKFRLNELSNSQRQVIKNVNLQNSLIDSTNHTLSRDVIPQLNDIHSQFDEHLDDHALLQTQLPGNSKDSVIKHTPNPVVESLREQINNLLVQMEHPDVKSTCENEKNENLKPSMDQLQKNLTILQDTLQKIMNQQIYIPAEETLRGFQDQIYLLQDKYNKQTRELNELKRSGNDQLEERINELEEKISSLKKQSIDNANNQVYGEEIAKESDRITTLENELRKLQEVVSKQRVTTREIEQPIMKTTPEGHFIIKKTKRLNGTTNHNVQILQEQIDQLTERIKNAEQEEEDEDIDGDLHSHLGKTSDDLILLREQLQRILEGYDVEEVVPISPQQMFDQLNDLLRRVSRLEGGSPQGITTRSINLDGNDEAGEQLQQLLSSYNTYAQQMNTHSSYLHQFKETIDEQNDRISDLESTIGELRNQLQDGALINELNESLKSVQDDVQNIKDQLELGDDYDVIEIEGGDADVMIDLEEDKNENNNNNNHRRPNDLPSRVRNLEKRIAELENGSPNLQLREVLTSDGLPYSEAGFNEAANSSIYKSNPQVKEIQDQIDELIKELNNSEFDSDGDGKTHVKKNVEETKKQLKVLQDALESLIRDDQKERVRLATLSPQKLLYKLDELNEEVIKMKETLNENVNQLQDHSDDFNALTNRVSELINAQNLLIQNSNAQNQKIRILTETVDDEDQKSRLDEIEDELRQHIENHDELITNNCLPISNNGSKSRTRRVAKPIRESKQKELSPYIKGIQNQIDALISNMNDLNEEQRQDEKQDKELDSRMHETQTELLLLQKTLGSLQNLNVNEYEIQEEEEEDDDEMNRNVKTRGISLEDSNDLKSKIEKIEKKLSQISDQRINNLENQINDLNNQLQDQPEQILSSLKLLWSKSPKGTSKYTAKKKSANPVIKDIQDQIDVLVSKMNDPSMMDQDQDDGELAPQLQQTQDELARLQEILKTLMEGIEEEEEEDSENNEALYISPALVLSRLIKIEKEFMSNSEMKTAIHCLKHEVKLVKYQDSYLQTLRTRTEEITESQNQVIKTVQGMKSYITKNHDQELKEQILELNERVELLENQPPFPVPIPSQADQIALNSMNSLPVSSSSRMIREIHRPRNVSPVIKEVQDQIDALVRKMNDPSIKKEKEKGSLNPSFTKTQAQLAKLRATLKRLQEMEDVEYIEDDMNRAEDDEFFNVPGNYLSKQLLVENISYLNQRVNHVLIPSIKCIKHELKNLKQNGIRAKSRGIVLDLQGEEEEEDPNERLKKLESNYENFMNRIEEISSSQNQVIFTLNQHKRMIDQANDKLETVNDAIEDHIENGTDRNVMERLQSIEQSVDDLQTNGFAQETRIPPKRKPKTREVNPVIQLLKEKIDELVEQMNDPGLKDNDEQTNNELNPDLNKAENEVLILREQLRKLLEEEEEEEEPEIIVTPESLYRSIQENKEKLILLEAMKVKNENEFGDRLQDVEERVDALNKRSEEYIDSHYKILQNNNANKSVVDKINDKLNEQQRTITDNYEELETRVASLEEGQNNSPNSFWGRPVSRSIQLGRKPVNPALKKLNRQIGELVDEMNDPQVQTKDTEQLKPKFNKAETELRTLQNTLTTIIGDDDDNDDELYDEIITPDSLYQMIRDLQDKVSSLENGGNSILSRSFALSSSPSKKKTTTRRKKYNNPELENLKKKIDALVQQMNDPSIERDEANSSTLKPEFTKAEKELQILRDTLNALLEEMEDEAEYDIDQIPLTAETLPEIITNLRSKSVNQEQSNTELRKTVQCLKHEVKKLKTKDSHPGTTEEELMSYCDRLQQIAERYDKHIVEAKNEMQRYREIKSQMKKDNEVTNSLQRSIKCLKYEVKNLKFNKRPRRSGNNGGGGGGDGGNNNNNGFDNGFDDDNGGDGSNRRHRTSTRSSGNGSKGKSGSGRSTRRSKTIEERVDILEDSQEKAIQNMNSQRSYIDEFNKAVHQISNQLDDHDQRIEDLEQQDNDNQQQTKKIVNRSLPFDFADDQENDLESLGKRLNELTGSQSSIIDGFNAQNQCINKLKDQIEEILSKQDDDDNILSKLESIKSTDEDAQESIRCLNNDLDEIRSSQALIVNNENKQNEAIRLLNEKINQLIAKQEQEEKERENNDAPVFDEEAQNSIKCLKYEMKKMKNQLNELSSSQNVVINNSNSQTSCIKRFNDKINDLLMKQEELEQKVQDQDDRIQKLVEENSKNKILEEEEEEKTAKLDEDTLKKIGCLKYETKRLKENIRFIDERVNQVTSSQKIITDNVNNQTGHINMLKEKFNELDMKQKEIESKNDEEQDEPVIQTREISLLPSDLENRVNELSSSHSTLVDTLNAQRSQIDRIKEKLNETMTNQKQLMENTDALLDEQFENKSNNNNNKDLYQPSSDQILRIEKELTELQKNHLHLKSQFYDHLKDNNNSGSSISLSQPLIDSINQLRESQNQAIKTVNAQSSIIRQLENKISTLEANVKDITNEIDDENRNTSPFDSIELQRQIESRTQLFEDRINELTTSQNKVIQVINTQTANVKRSENELQQLRQEVKSLQRQPSLSGEEIDQIQDEIANLRDSSAYGNDEIQNIKEDISPLKDELRSLKDQIQSLNDSVADMKPTTAVVERDVRLDNETDSKIDSLNRSIKCIKYEVKKLISLQSRNNVVEADVAKIKSKVLKIDEFNKNQLVPHINQLEAATQKLREKTKKLTENDQKIVQHSEKMKQDIKQLNEMFNISPYLITTGDEQRKNNLRSFFESVASTLNEHSSLLVQLEQRMSNQENQSSFIQQPKSPKQLNKNIKDEDFNNNAAAASSGFVSTADFQKYTTNQNLLIEQLKRKISTASKSSSSASSISNNTLNNELSNIKKEIESLKITEIRKDIDTIKNNLKNTMSYSDDVIVNETQKVESLLSRIDKLEDQFASKIAEIDSKNTELDELRKYTSKLAKHVKSHEEKIKTIKDTSNAK